GSINNHAFYEEILALKPDLIITYGCSIIKYPLLSGFKEHIINVHLGLSPYYRGAATNFWPLVNKEPEYVGATFMYIDAGIDTGEIIHQIRPRITWGDTPSSIGNRLIKDMTETFARLVVYFDKLKKLPPPEKGGSSRLYHKKDYSLAAVEQLYRHFNSGLIENYLHEKEERLAKAPILVNPVLK
ncbi:formyl transferase, partial [Bradyrhizobium sp. NBAIM08]|uniref:formyl transferase n=1 Tax=Bradyrhizobium sp. NBAIM08 TaxID=2793815 RepID=UPI001CD63708